MFELKVALRYLCPSRKQLSLSLIALMSTLVITLVVWLLILFLSVTEGIETTWLNRLTALNGPIRVIPTGAYYDSYYYQIDAFSRDSGYSYKSLRDKLLSKGSDPYQSDQDETLPIYLPEKITDAEGNTEDFVKALFQSLDNLKQRHKGIYFQEYETAGAMLKLALLRPSMFLGQGVDHSFLTQASYVTSFSGKSPLFQELILPPSATDINNLLFLSKFSSPKQLQDSPLYNQEASYDLQKTRLLSICQNLSLEKVSLEEHKWGMPHSIIDQPVKAYAKIHMGSVSYIVIPPEKNLSISLELLEEGKLYRKDGNLYFQTKKQEHPVDPYIPMLLSKAMEVSARFVETSFQQAEQLSELQIEIEGSLQNHPFRAISLFQGVHITKATAKTKFSKMPKLSPPWAYTVDGTCYMPNKGILLPKNMQDNKVHLGDKGYLSYTASTSTMMQEQRLPIEVVGFYDPGVMAVGARSVIADYDTVHAISSASSNLAIDDLMASGVQVWTSDLKKIKLIKEEIEQELSKKNLSPYWAVVPFYEYDFAKDLMTQFQSDRYLFMIIGIIILTVACSNIISLLLLLVKDKRYEIGVMLSLGAKKRSLAWIFGIIGASIGIFSALMGAFLAYITLKNLDSLVHLLNFLEGQQAFNSAFYGESLPNQLSHQSLVFILLTTPILSIIAGIIPAWKASRLRPCAILRSE